MASNVSPVSFDVNRPSSQSRITNFPLFIGALIRGFLLIPHLAILYLFGAVAQLLVFIGHFAILFTGNFPRGMFDMVVGYHRWSANVYGYLFHLYDDYPPFSPDYKPGFPLALNIEYPSSLSRILNFPFFIGTFIKLVLLIPHLIALAFLLIVASLIAFIAPFAILFTGSYPAGMHNFMVGVGRWSMRINAYTYSLTDKYPPFSMS